MKSIRWFFSCIFDEKNLSFELDEDLLHFWYFSRLVKKHLTFFPHFYHRISELSYITIFPSFEDKLCHCRKMDGTLYTSNFICWQFSVDYNFFSVWLSFLSFLSLPGDKLVFNSFKHLKLLMMRLRCLWTEWKDEKKGKKRSTHRRSMISTCTSPLLARLLKSVHRDTSTNKLAASLADVCENCIQHFAWILGFHSLLSPQSHPTISCSFREENLSWWGNLLGGT